MVYRDELPSGIIIQDEIIKIKDSDGVVSFLLTLNNLSPSFYSMLSNYLLTKEKRTIGSFFLDMLNSSVEGNMVYILNTVDHDNIMNTVKIQRFIQEYNLPFEITTRGLTLINDTLIQFSPAFVVEKNFKFKDVKCMQNNIYRLFSGGLTNKYTWNATTTRPDDSPLYFSIINALANALIMCAMIFEENFKDQYTQISIENEDEKEVVMEKKEIPDEDKNPVNPNKFYLVYLKGGNQPKFKHSSFTKAEAEAKRLAKQFHKKTYVAIPVASYEYEHIRVDNLSLEFDEELSRLQLQPDSVSDGIAMFIDDKFEDDNKEFIEPIELLQFNNNNDDLTDDVAPF